MNIPQTTLTYLRKRKAMFAVENDDKNGNG